MKYPNVRSLYFATPFAFNVPRPRGSPGTISVKFCVKVRGWLWYKMAKKHCRKFQLPEYGAQTLQTTDGFGIAQTRT